MPINKKYFSLSPLNETENGFSYKNGNGRLRFSIPSQMKLLEGSSLRLTYRILFQDNSGNLQLFNNLLNLNGSDQNYITYHVNLPNFGGTQCLIDKITIQSKKSNKEIVNKNNYAQITSLLMANGYSDLDYLCTPLCQSLASGYNAYNLSRRLCCMTTTDENDSNTGQLVSHVIHEEFLKDLDIPLSADYVDGLILNFHLLNDSDFFTSRYRTSPTNPDLDISGWSYTIKDVKLEGRYVELSPQEQKLLSPTIVYSQNLNLINDVHSSSSSTTYTPNLQLVSSIVNVFQAIDQRNNYNRNLNEFNLPVGLTSVTQAKNSLRFPYDYLVEQTPNYQTINNIQDLFTPAGAQGDSEVRRQFFLALLNGKLPYHTTASINLTNESLQELYDTSAPTLNVGVHDNLLVDILGIGTNYSHTMGLIQNFNNQDYSLNINSGVNTNNGNLPAQTRDISFTQETFINHLAEFDYKNLNKLI